MSLSAPPPRKWVRQFFHIVRSFFFFLCNLRSLSGVKHIALLRRCVFFSFFLREKGKKSFEKTPTHTKKEPFLSVLGIWHLAKDCLECTNTYTPCAIEITLYTIQRACETMHCLFMECVLFSSIEEGCTFTLIKKAYYFFRVFFCGWGWQRPWKFFFCLLKNFLLCNTRGKKQWFSLRLCCIYIRLSHKCNFTFVYSHPIKVMDSPNPWKLKRKLLVVKVLQCEISM